MSTLVSVLCLPLPSLHAFDFYEIFLLLVIIIHCIIVSRDWAHVYEWLLSKNFERLCVCACTRRAWGRSREGSLFAQAPASMIMAQCYQASICGSMLCIRHQYGCALCINMAHCCASCIQMAQFGLIICIMHSHGSVQCIMHKIILLIDELYWWIWLNYTHSIDVHQASIVSITQCCASGINMAVHIMLQYIYGSMLCIHSSMMYIRHQYGLYQACIHVTQCCASGIIIHGTIILLY